MSYILCLVPTILYALSYSIGGRDYAPLVRPRIWRRFIAPLCISIGVIILSLIFRTFSPLMIISIGAYIASMFLTKYGGDTLWQKVSGRVLSGFVVGIASFAIAYTTSSWILFILQIVLSIFGHIALGIYNPLEAQYEEFIISFLTVVLVPFMVL